MTVASCAWCGQRALCEREADEHGAWWTCARCLAADESPEAVPLFEPAPAPMPGQLGMDVDP